MTRLIRWRTVWLVLSAGLTASGSVGSGRRTRPTAALRHILFLRPTKFKDSGDIWITDEYGRGRRRLTRSGTYSGLASRDGVAACVDTRGTEHSAGGVYTLAPPGRRSRLATKWGGFAGAGTPCWLRTPDIPQPAAADHGPTILARQSHSAPAPPPLPHLTALPSLSAADAAGGNRLFIAALAFAWNQLATGKPVATPPCWGARRRNHRRGC